MVVLACRVLAIAVALSCLVRAEAYLSTESGKTYECDITKVDAFTASENQKRCKEFCTRVKKTVDDMESDDTGKKKKCRQTAVGLADLMSMDMRSVAAEKDVEEAVKKIHITEEPGCLAALMNDWAGRDASCEAAAAGDAKTPASVVKKRLLLLLTQYYTSSSSVSAHRRELIEEPGADIAARRVRRAGSHEVPEAKEFCIFQYARFVSTHSQTLFDSKQCAGKHPLWSEMESCEKTECWATMKPILDEGGGCLALYYDLYFSMVYADGRIDSAGDGKLTSTTVESLFKTDSNVNIPEYVEEACKKKTPPCTSIDAAIEKCAGKDYGSKYSSTIESADTFGNVAKGGVRCWQGSSCH
jgi:hypothetical protein